ncbi:hypothetical protein OS493_021432 [Desmophyllum pertusum]|uniref:Uncharacterized protein n=1 Tax=Desmophyllum pertusum TaxID=174260 RepID=A0A9W9YYZ7_9CNID|nr:hypothetical protein OS493_021432 [Desmophyllum pertusum]
MQNDVLNIVLQPPNSSCSTLLYFEQIKKSRHWIPMVHTSERACAKSPLFVVSSNYNQNKLYQEAFFMQDPELHQSLQRLAEELGDTCKDGARTRVEKAHVIMVNAINSLNVLEKMSTFEAANANNTMFKSDATLHAYGHGDAGVHQSCPNRRLVTTPYNPRDVHQVLLCS